MNLLNIHRDQKSGMAFYVLVYKTSLPAALHRNFLDLVILIEKILKYSRKTKFTEQAFSLQDNVSQSIFTKVTRLALC